MPETKPSAVFSARYNRGLPNSVKSLKKTQHNTAKEARLRNEFKRSETRIQAAAHEAELHTENAQLQQSGAIELDKNEQYRMITQRDILQKNHT